MERKITLLGGEKSRDDPGGLADLHGLGTAFCAELIKEPAGMGLHGIFADEEVSGDLTIAKAGGDEAKNLQFTGGNAELTDTSLVDDEGIRRLRGDFLDDGGGLFPGEGEAEPDAECGKEGGDQGNVDLDGMLEDEEAVLSELQDNDEQAANHAVEEDVAEGAAARIGVRFGGQGNVRP